jgi:hypothetical protein
MKWLSPELGVGAVVAFIIIMIGFIFLRRVMMGGRKSMGGPRKMGKWNRMGRYDPALLSSARGSRAPTKRLHVLIGV